MNTLSNIVVYIKDEAMLEEAREILDRNGQTIADDNTFSISINNYVNYLRYDEFYINEWWLGSATEREEITLTELEQLLKQNRDER